MKTEKITVDNFKLVRTKITIIKEILVREFQYNREQIKLLEKRQQKIKNELKLLSDEGEIVGEFEMESEYKFLELIERNCKRCGKLYDKRHSNDELCPACLTSNA